MTTYNHIPKIKDFKFETPVTIEPIEVYDEQGLRKELSECKNELSNLMLFTETPKHSEVNEKYPLPYYDSTYSDRITKIQEIRNRIIEINHKLNIFDDDIELYVEVRNSTFPLKSSDMLKHYNETYFNINQK